MITAPYPFTRRIFEEEEIIISICNQCLAVVAQSGDEEELAGKERKHQCAAGVQRAAA